MRAADRLLAEARRRADAANHEVVRRLGVGLLRPAPCSFWTCNRHTPNLRLVRRCGRCLNCWENFRAT